MKIKKICDVGNHVLVNIKMSGLQPMLYNFIAQCEECGTIYGKIKYERQFFSFRYDTGDRIINVEAGHIAAMWEFT